MLKDPTLIGYSPVYSHGTEPSEDQQRPVKPLSNFNMQNPWAVFVTGLVWACVGGVATFSIMDGLYGGKDIRDLESQVKVRDEALQSQQHNIDSALQVLGCK